MNERRFGSAHINFSPIESGKAIHTHTHNRKYTDISDYYWKWCYVCDISREAFCLPSILLILTYARIKGAPQQLCRTLSGIIYSHIDQKNEILNEKHAHSRGPTHTFFAICVQCQGHIEIDEMPWLPSANFVLSTSGLGELKSTSMFYPNI